LGRKIAGFGLIVDGPCRLGADPAYCCWREQVGGLRGQAKHQAREHGCDAGLVKIRVRVFYHDSQSFN